MKRSELLRRIGRRVKSQDKEWDLTRQGGNHEVWMCGRTLVIVPRHNEINEYTAQGIFKDLERELGKGWWR